MRRTVEPYNKCRDQLHNFVVIDLDVPGSPEQQKLARQRHNGYIQHVLVLNERGQILYGQPNKIDSQQMDGNFRKSPDG
jgi:hypothetical protein